MERLSFSIGNKVIGANAPVLLQTMGDHKTSDTKTAIEECLSWAKQGLDLVRFSVLDEEDARALKTIKEASPIPVIADIHFEARLALLALESGVDKIRINPGNIGSEARLREVIQACKKHHAAMRIGVNHGSLAKYKGKTTTPEGDYFLALDNTLSVFRSEGFTDIVLSLKSSSPSETRRLYEMAYPRYPYPLHIGVTESGFGVVGAVKSAYALGPLLEEGIGDTLRISLADDRKEEIRAMKALLKATGRRKDLPDLIVCPTCGRTRIDVKPISRLLEEKLDVVFKPVKVAVMGCPVNGIGEARDADFGIAGSGEKDIYLLFRKGVPVGLFPKEEALEKLFGWIDAF